MIRIADFGFSRNLAPTDMAATICGSPLYMAPEILRHERYDAKADLWSVGAILFECLTGKPPFDGPNPMQLLANIEQSKGLQFQAGSTLSVEGRNFLALLLEKDPRKRLSGDEFMRHKYVAETHKYDELELSLFRSEETKDGVLIKRDHRKLLTDGEWSQNSSRNSYSVSNQHSNVQSNHHKNPKDKDEFILLPDQFAGGRPNGSRSPDDFSMVGGNHFASKGSDQRSCGGGSQSRNNNNNTLENDENDFRVDTLHVSRELLSFARVRLEKRETFMVGAVALRHLFRYIEQKSTINIQGLEADYTEGVKIWKEKKAEYVEIMGEDETDQTVEWREYWEAEFDIQFLEFCIEKAVSVCAEITDANLFTQGRCNLRIALCALKYWDEIYAIEAAVQESNRVKEIIHKVKDSLHVFAGEFKHFTNA